MSSWSGIEFDWKPQLCPVCFVVCFVGLLVGFFLCLFVCLFVWLLCVPASPLFPPYALWRRWWWWWADFQARFVIFCNFWNCHQPDKYKIKIMKIDVSRVGQSTGDDDDDGADDDDAWAKEWVYQPVPSYTLCVTHFLCARTRPDHPHYSNFAEISVLSFIVPIYQWVRF